MSEYTSVAENEKHATFWEDVAQKKKQREEAAKKQQEQLEALQQETQRLAAELEMQKMIAEEQRAAEAERQHQNQIAALQKEKERLAAELAKHAEELQRREYSYTPSDYEALKKTVYGHSCDQPLEAQMGVAFVVMNRAKANRSKSVHGICHEPGQFWIGLYGEPDVKNLNIYNSIDQWLPDVMKGKSLDITNGAFHFVPIGEQHDWLNGRQNVATFGKFSFYR